MQHASVRPGGSARPRRRRRKSKEYVLTYVGRYNKPDKYENIILKTSPDGEILRLKDVGQVELGPQFFDIYSDVDGHPSAAIVLKQLPGWNAAIVIEAVKKDLEEIKEESFPPGMDFEVIPLERPGHDLCGHRDSSGLDTRIHERQVPRVGGDRQRHRRNHLGLLAGRLPDPDRGPRLERGDLSHPFEEPVRPQADLAQIIEKLEEKCRTISNVNLEFFEPPAVSVFVAAGGFSVRVLDKTNSNNDKRLGRVPETFMDDLLKRKDLEGLFTFLASNYPQYELVINNDVAMQKGVSIANAMESLSIVVGGDVQAERKFRRLAEDFSHLSFKNDRGEMVPYSSFMELKKKQGLNEIDR